MFLEDWEGKWWEINWKINLLSMSKAWDLYKSSFKIYKYIKNGL